MKVAMRKVTENVEAVRALVVGDRVDITHSGEASRKFAFTLQSLAHDNGCNVYVFVSEPMSGFVRSTLIMKLGSTDPSVLIGGSVTSVNVRGISLKGVDVVPNADKMLCCKTTKRQSVTRPIKVDDVLLSDRREYRVEYIAQDGSLICRMYSRKEDSKYVGMTVIHQGEFSLLKSLHEPIEFAYA